MTLEHHFVAFIDILGFSEMVRADCEGPRGSEKNLQNLFSVHQQTIERFNNNDEFNIIQFSDSVVISRVFEKGAFIDFVETVAIYQNDLFERGLLCRGGIAYGKHLVNGSFLFSSGLIEAYRLESLQAKFPRILVSKDLIELVANCNTEKESLRVLQDQDGAIFVDYLSLGQLAAIRNFVEQKLDGNLSPSVKEKILWISKYYDHLVETHGGTKLSVPNFRPLVDKN